MFRGYVMMCFILEVLFSPGIVKGNIEEQELDIKKKLLADYDPSLPPILYSHNDFYTLVSFNIFRIRGLDEKKGEFTVEGQIIMVWVDERISWESSEVTSITVSTKDIWVPSIYIYNEIEPEEMTLDPLPVIVEKAVIWAPYYTIRTRCIPNLRYYPFDKNVCDIVIASRNIEVDFLNTSSKSLIYKGVIQTRAMLDNPQWHHDKPKVYHKKIKISSDIKKDVIVYRFYIQRSMPLIPLSILTPCMACSLIFLTTFWMEAGSTLRAGLCVTSTLVSSSCLFTLSKILPFSGSDTPIIVEYVSITLILSAVSSIQTTLASIFRRCEMLPPISYATIISKIPSWCLILMGITPEKAFSQQLDQKFLFSELGDQEGRQDLVNEENSTNVEQSADSVLMQSLWIKYTILFDRAMFYLIGLIFLLFVISVIVTE